MTAAVPDVISQVKDLRARTNGLMSLQSLPKARAILEKALASANDNVTLLTLLGTVLCDMKLDAEAQKHLERAAELGSRDRNTYFALYVAMCATGTMEAAKAIWIPKQALEPDPDTWEPYVDFQSW